MLNAWHANRQVMVIIVWAAPLITGCGSNVDEILFQVAGAAGRTAVDLWLTEAANATLDAIEGQSGDDGTGGPDDTPPSFDGFTGNAEAGRTLFTQNSCINCHCADGSGGCALNAPAIAGQNAETIYARTVGGTPHPGGKFNFNEQDIVDIEAFLANIAP